jgi:hypothetical protein
MPDGKKPNASSVSALEEARLVASRFDLPYPIEAADFPDKGNIHRQTYLVTAGSAGNSNQFLLQRINTQVFVRPDRTMRAMIACIEAQRKAITEGALPAAAHWEPIRLIPTKAGEAYLKIEGHEGPEYWRMMARIPRARSFKSLAEIRDPGERIRIAEETGKGLALFGILTAGMGITGNGAAGSADPLPGYRNTDLYFGQLASVLNGSRTLDEAAPFLPDDPLLRESCGNHFIVRLSPDEYRRRINNPLSRQLVSIALEQKQYGLELQTGLATGKLRTVTVHGDPKLDNFLFSTRTAKVVSLVDLDTVMPHTWLSDWGDMARSLINTSGEKVRNRDEIEISMDVFKALARGFIGLSPRLPAYEAAMMVDAARIMALELGVRFLADYLRGDSYFILGGKDPEDLNRTRAAVQFSVLQRLGDTYDEAKRYIEDLRLNSKPD